MAVEIVAPGGTVTVTGREWTAEAAGQACVAEVVANVAVMPTYRGPYEVTPGPEDQTLETDGLMMRGNVTIGAVPSNYGLIAWNGVALTVS